MKWLSSNLLGYQAIAALFTLATAAVDNDPCKAIAGRTTASFSEAKACLEYFPFNQTLADKTIEIIRKVTSELYVFNVIMTLLFFLSTRSHCADMDVG